MKFTCYKLISAIIISCYCSFCLASSNETKLDRILFLSGITKNVEQFPNLIKTGLRKGFEEVNTISEADASVMIKSIDETILTSVIMDEIQLSIKSSLNSSEIEMLLQWYESDRGKMIVAAKENASTMQAKEEIIKQTQQLLAKTDRTEYAARLDELVGGTDLAMKIQEFSGYAVYSAILAVVAPDQKIDLETYNAELEKSYPQMRENLKQYVITSFVYTYQNIDDQDLFEYEKFLNQPATRQFYASLIEGLKNGFEKVVLDWINEVHSRME